MENNIRKTIFVLVVSAFALNGCGNGEADEAKKLGFASIEEMKEVHAKGWHTKAQYLHDNPSLANSSVSNKNINETKEAASQSPAVQVAAKWDNDDFVECVVTARTGLEINMSSGKATARQLEDSNNLITLFDRVLNFKKQGGQLTQKQFDSKYQMLAKEIPAGGVARSGRTNDWYESCIQNALTVSRVFNKQQNSSEANIRHISLPSAAQSSTADLPEQLASKIPPMDAARCGIVFSSYGAIMINSNQTDEGLAGMRFTQATQYVVNQAVSRGEPSQLFENAQKAYSQEMRVTPPNNIVNEATACAKVFRPLFLALDARGYIKR